jgi:hypothetical protein
MQELKAWKSIEYNPEAHYPITDLDAMIQQAEDLVKKEPEFESEISERLDTMRKHREQLRAGHVYWKGQWNDPKEIEANYNSSAEKLYREFFVKITLCHFLQ